MRANLLPQERRHLELFGASLDLEFLKRTLGLAALLAVTFGAVAAIQSLRAEIYRRDAFALETQLAVHDLSRQQVAGLARDVALLQRIDRASELARSSSSRVVLDTVKVGNAIPRGVWLDTLGRSGDNYFLSGGAFGIGAVSEMLHSIAAAQPELAATLVRLDRPITGDTVRFTLRIIRERRRK
jgi:Tfp pilus assembly protein PilN